MSKCNSVSPNVLLSWSRPHGTKAGLSHNTTILFALTVRLSSIYMHQAFVDQLHVCSSILKTCLHTRFHATCFLCMHTVCSWNAKIGFSQSHQHVSPAVAITVYSTGSSPVAKGGRILYTVTFDQRRGWADNISRVDIT